MRRKAGELECGVTILRAGSNIEQLTCLIVSEDQFVWRISLHNALNCPRLLLTAED